MLGHFILIDLGMHDLFLLAFENMEYTDYAIPLMMSFLLHLGQSKSAQILTPS